MEDTLPCGIYALPDEGGAGKTYFGKLLRSMGAKKCIRVSVMSYNKDYEEEDYVRLLDKVGQDIEILFLDRLDLYLTDEIAKKIVILAETCKVFLDLKDWDITHIFLPKSTKMERMRDGVEIEYVSYDI